jgi:hypothetical protein
MPAAAQGVSFETEEMKTPRKGKRATPRRGRKRSQHSDFLDDFLGEKVLKPSPMMEIAADSTSQAGTAPQSVGVQIPGVAATASAGDIGVEITPKPISIIPTVYPQDPGGTITVQNYITINVRGADFRDFEDKMGELFAELRKSNEIAGEVRDKLIAEMNAGITILKSPKPDRQVIDQWLVRPLKYIAEKVAGTVIGALATTAVRILLRMMGVL